MDLLKLFADKVPQLAQLVDPKILELLEAIAGLGTKLPVIAAKVSSAPDPVSLFEAIRSGLDDAAITAAFAAVGADAELAKIKTLAAQFTAGIPNEIKLLLQPLAQFEEAETRQDEGHAAWSVGADPGRIGWDKSGQLTSPKTLSTIKADAKFELGGSIALDCEAGSLWFYGGDNVASKGLLRIGIAGVLNAGVEGKVPFGSLGSGSLDIAAAIACNAHLFWRNPEELLYGEVLFDALSHPVDVFDLDAVWKASRGSFAGFILTLDGHASINVDIALAREFDVDGLFSGRAGLTVSIEVSRKAAYELSLLKVPDGLRMILSHGKDDVDNWGIGLGIDIDAAPLAERVGKLVGDAADHWDKLLEEVKPFLTPGTWLRENAAEQLDGLLDSLLGVAGTDAIADALRRDLTLASGGNPGPGKSLATALSKKAVQAISGLEGKLTGKIEELSDQAAALLTAKLPALIADPLQAKLKAALSDLVGLLQTGFTDKATVIANANGDKVEKALKQLGQKISAGATDLDKRTASLRALIEKADRIVQQVTAATKDAAMAKISARLSFEKSRVSEEQYEFRGTFTAAPGAEARALYRALMFGRMQGLAPFFSNEPYTIPGFRFEPARSSIRRFSSVSTVLGYEVVLLGLNLSGKAEISGSADVSYEPGGKITVNAVATAKRSAQGWKQARKICFTHAFELALAKVEEFSPRPPELRRGMTIELSTDRSDENLTVKELDFYLSSMVRMQLLTEARKQKMVDALKADALSRGNTKLSGAVSISMAFGWPEVSKLLDLGRGVGGPDFDKSQSDAAKKIFYAGLDAMRRSGEWRDDDLKDWVAKSVRKTGYFKGTPELTLSLTWQKLFEKRAESLVMPISPGSKGGLVPTPPAATINGQKLEALRGLVIMLATMDQIYAAIPASVSDTNLSHWTMERYRDAEYTVAGKAQNWLRLNSKFLAFFRDGISARSLAFMRALAILGVGELEDDESYEGLFTLSLALNGGAAQSY